MRKTVVTLTNATKQQKVENFAKALAKIIATGIKQSPSPAEVEGNIREILQSPSEELENSLLPLVSDEICLADGAIMTAFKDAMWINSREIIHEIIDLLNRQELTEESRAE